MNSSFTGMTYGNGGNNTVTSYKDKKNICNVDSLGRCRQSGTRKSKKPKSAFAIGSRNGDGYGKLDVYK